MVVLSDRTDYGSFSEPSSSSGLVGSNGGGGHGGSSSLHRGATLIGSGGSGSSNTNNANSQAGVLNLTSSDVSLSSERTGVGEDKGVGSSSAISGGGSVRVTSEEGGSSSKQGRKSSLPSTGSGGGDPVLPSPSVHLGLALDIGLRGDSQSAANYYVSKDPNIEETSISGSAENLRSNSKSKDRDIDLSLSNNSSLGGGLLESFGCSSCVPCGGRVLLDGVCAGGDESLDLVYIVEEATSSCSYAKRKIKGCMTQNLNSSGCNQSNAINVDEFNNNNNVVDRRRGAVEELDRIGNKNINHCVRSKGPVKICCGSKSVVTSHRSKDICNIINNNNNRSGSGGGRSSCSSVGHSGVGIVVTVDGGESRSRSVSLETNCNSCRIEELCDKERIGGRVTKESKEISDTNLATSTGDLPVFSCSSSPMSTNSSGELNQRQPLLHSCDNHDGWLHGDHDPEDIISPTSPADLNRSRGSAIRVNIPSSGVLHHQLDPELPGGHSTSKYPKEKKKTIIAFLILVFNFILATVSLSLTHERLPERKPLPDIVLDNVEAQDWALYASEILIMISTFVTVVVLVLNKHRWIVFRRAFLILSVLYLMRSLTMYVTVLPVASYTYHCSPKSNTTTTFMEVVRRVIHLVSGFGLSINGQHTYCGDYIYSGHTVILVTAYLFIQEYTPKKLLLLHWTSWLASLTGVIMILVSRGHYTVDVLIAYYVTTRLFWLYHTVANNPQLRDSSTNYLSRIWWFPIFRYMERNVGGPLPKHYSFPWSSKHHRPRLSI